MRLLGIGLASTVGVAVMATPALAKRPDASVAPVVTSNLPSLRTSSASASFSWTTSPATSESYTCFLDGIKSNCGSGTTGQKPYSGLADGSHTFFVRAKRAGHFRAVQSNSIVWTIDHTSPAAPTVDQPPSPSNVTTPNVTFSEPSSAEPISGYACVLSATKPATAPAAANCTSPWSPTSLLTNGQYTLWVYAFDTALPTPNVSAPGSTTWTVDLSAPGVPDLTATPSKLNNSSSATFTWTDESGSSSACSLDNAAFTACGGAVQPRTITFNTLGEGDHTFLVKDTDSAANTGAPASYAWHIDLTAPDAPLVNGPGTTDDATATFSYSDTDKTVSFLCRLDGQGGFTACQQSYGPLSDGAHALEVLAQDPAGNQSAVTSVQWTVDTSTTGPVALSPVEFLSAPDGYSNLSPVTFTWLGLDETTTGFLCALDTSTFTACGSPDINGDGSHQVTVGTEGPHVFAVKATDGTNVSPATSWRWTYDKTPPPAPTFSAKPGDPSNSTSALFSFASEPSATFTCSLDGAAAQPCATPATFSGLSQASHTFAVTASDAAGNSSTSSYTWLIDLSAPPAPVLSGPSGYSNAASAQLSWTDAGSGLTFTCSLDTVALASCDNPTQLSNLADGSHTFAVSASNGTKSTTTSRSWTVDTIKPALTVSSLPSEGSLTNATTITPSVTQVDANAGAIACSLSGPTPASTCGPFTALADGAYTLTVDTTDLAGNTADEVVRHWTIDSTAPTLDVSGVPNGVTNATTVTPVVNTPTDAHPGPLVCSLTGPVSSSACGPYAGLMNGSYQLTIDTTDQAGNAATQYVGAWVVDTVAPALDVTGVPSGTVNTTSVTPNPTQVDANPGAITCALTGPVSQSGCGPFSGLTDGDYTLKLDTTDQAGNAAVELVKTWTVDTVAPPAPVVSSPGQTPNPTITFTSSEPGDTFRCSVDGGPFVPCTSPWTPPAGLSDGSHTLVVETVDAAGNTKTAPPITFVVANAPGTGSDTTPPTATIVATKTLTGASTATFSEAVHGLTAGGAALVVTGTPTVVPVNLSCLSGGTKVKCATAFTSLRLTPKSALIPGQHYTVRLLAGAVKDGNGNPLVAKSVNFRASRAEQETTPGAKALWPGAKTKAAYGGSLVRENTAGASATYAFTGTNVTWWTVTGPNQGKAAVYIDGVRKAIVSNYATATHYKVARKYAKLANKRHTLKIVVRGVKGAKAGTGTFVTVDAFSVGKARANSPALITKWRSLAAQQFSGSHAVAAKTRGATFTFVFRGTAVSWVTERARNQGKVAVYIDGVRKAVVDNYSTTTRFGVRRSLSGLSDKVHTLKLVVLGTHRKGGTGTWVTVDRFLVG